MELLKNWYATANKIVRNPKEFFASIPKDDLNTALKFAVISFLIAGLIQVPYVLLSSLGISVGLTAIILVPIIGLIGVIIGGVIFHVLLYIMGARKGLKATLSVGAYVTVFSVIYEIISYFSLIPFGGFVISGLLILILSLYSIYVSIQGYSILHEISVLRAAIVVIAPILIAIVIVGFAYFWIANVQLETMGAIAQNMQNIS